MFISGIVPFRNKKEKLAAFRDLKDEFGDTVRIIFKEGFMTYTVHVPRTHL